MLHISEQNMNMTRCEVMNLRTLGISQTQPETGRDKGAYARCQDVDFGVKMS